MNGLSLPRHDVLSARFRLAGLRPAPSAMLLADWLLLGLFGALAATMSTLLDFSLRIPGHAILRAVFPMVAELALVPRRGAGKSMQSEASLSEWLGRAPATYLASGLVAPLLSGMVWSSLQRRPFRESIGDSRSDSADEPQ